jgi:hypothetical protein
MNGSSVPPRDPVVNILDGLISDVQSTFHAFLLAQATLQLGRSALASIQGNTVIQATLGVAVEIEPIPIGELRQYQNAFPTFLLEVFHGKIIQYWQDCLTRIFSHYLSLHFDGIRQFVELKTQDIRIDFASEADITDQLRFAMLRNFEFREYSDRVRLIDRIRNQGGRFADDLRNVHKHVQIRNAVQHRHGVLDDFSLRKLGTTQIKLMDDTGTEQEIGEGGKIVLAIPELDALRRSILLVGQAWRQ